MTEHEPCGEENCAFCVEHPVHLNVADHHADGSATISQWIFAPDSYQGLCEWLTRTIGIPQVELIMSKDDVDAMHTQGSDYVRPIISYADEPD